MQKENSLKKIVQGEVSDVKNRKLAGLLVRAFDRDMRSEAFLGDCETDAQGKYIIRYFSEQFNLAEKKTADLCMRVYTAEGKELLFESDLNLIRFNAADVETINITITKEIKPDGNEFDNILGELHVLTGKVKIHDLREDEIHRDITFLSKETGIPAEKLEHFVTAHRLGIKARIDAAFFYALLRKNTLLRNDFTEWSRLRLSVDINTDLLPLLYEAALTREKDIERDILLAVKETIVPERLALEWQRYYGILKTFRQKAQEYYQNEHPQKVSEVISRFVTEGKPGRMTEIFQKHRNDLKGLVENIFDKSFFQNESNAESEKVSLLPAEIFGADDAIISFVRKARNIESPKDFRKLARLNKAEWKKLMLESAEEINVGGRPLNKKLIDFHAVSLAKKMESEFPSVAFTVQLEREKKSVLKNHKAIRDFLVKHEDFDLQTDNIDLFLKDKKTDGKTDQMRDELKSVQRIFKLVPHYRKTNALLEKNITSAQSIAAIGETRFVNEIAPEAGISHREALEIFNKAERTATAVMLAAGELQQTMRSNAVAALRMSSRKKKLEAVSKDFPNLKSLFNLTDVCACRHCRSVYSPAAYLVEILRFLDMRSVVDLTVPAPPSGTRPPVKNAKDVLFKRRPDLGDIDLSCENANTPIPYIDLVCELLEEIIAPDNGISYNGALTAGKNSSTGKISPALLKKLTNAGLKVTPEAQIFETETDLNPPLKLPYYLRDKQVVCKLTPNQSANSYTVKRLRQTLASAEELAAAPAYVNQKAYEKLRDSVFAFKLPFDLDLTEARAYFSRFGIERAELMRDFGKDGMSDHFAVAVEELGLTKAEGKIIVTPELKHQRLFWNTAKTNPADELKIVDAFLNKTGLKYSELELLLSLKFINRKNDLFIKHSDLKSCDTAKKEIVNLDESALDRIHRFLRLQKKTGWRFEILDEIIGQKKLGDQKLDENCLVRAADLKRLAAKTGIKLEELVGFYGEIPFREFPNSVTKPLYEQIFLNKAKNGFIDEKLLPAAVNGAQTLISVQTSLSACLGLTEQEFVKLLKLLPNDKLTFASLSFLFAASRLMQKLKLKVDDFIILTELTGKIFQNSPALTLEFVKQNSIVKLLPLELADVKFILRHEAANLAEREIRQDKIEELLKKLQKEFQADFTANRSPFDESQTAEAQKEPLQNLLSKLNNVSENDVRIFAGLIDGIWKFKWIDKNNQVKISADSKQANDFLREKLGRYFDTTLIEKALTSLGTPIFTNPPNQAEHDKLFEIRRKNLVRSLLDSLTDYFFKNAKKKSLAQILAATFKVSEELAGIVAENAKVKQSESPNDVIGDLLQMDALIDKTHSQPVLPPVSDGTFPKQFNAVRLLHKLFPLINSFKLENENLAWHLKHNSSLGWFQPDAIPYKTEQNLKKSGGYGEFAEMLSIAKQLTPVPNPVDVENPLTFYNLAEMLLPSSTATQADWINAFSLLTGYEKADVADVDEYLFPEFDPDNYSEAANWKRVEKCLEHLRKLGLTVKQVKKIIEPDLTAAETALLRTALKSRYEEETWLGTLKQINDVIRPQKRDALVAYLLASNPGMKDENDLYDYLLVDVEMEACMPSSRIVQAHGTIQLFVQRCLMGLEPRAVADLNDDKKWAQWKWMKNYRVWEANRKVFLYPENWIEAELRDDKSFLFRELENELQQNELTAFTAENAFINYLEKLDDIAFLEVVATWYQSDIKTMHVFARTKGGTPAIYYYRRFEQERYWTPWEKVELDITGDHLLAFVRNNRLCLTWLIFTEEPEPKPQCSIPDSEPGSSVDLEKPKRKLVIQLAISEFANKKWQPKKISAKGIHTPSEYVSDDLPRENYNLTYLEAVEQIYLFSTGINEKGEHHTLNGIFNLTGCKGYPELLWEGSTNFEDILSSANIALDPDFLPDFKHSILKTQRYTDVWKNKVNELSVKNGMFFIDFVDLLAKTPNDFKITSPLQVTFMDWVLLIVQWLMKLIFSREGMGKTPLKIPFGTLLPYFMEDSFHAYVIIPGAYGEVKDENGKTVYLKRTGSNVLQLWEDFIALFVKYTQKYEADPNQDLDALVAELKADKKWLDIRKELKIYSSLKYGEQFKNMNHPLVCPLRTTLYKNGIPEFMKRETQMQVGIFDFNSHYEPTAQIPLPRPVEDIDFSSDGSYSGYNWEMFFHIPFLIATRLTKNQRFEEALEWFHYIFNPTGALEGDIPQKYWVTKPFYQMQKEDYDDQLIDNLLYHTANPSDPRIDDLQFAIDQWREKPFQPHAIARFRPVAYQKALLMKYIDNLTEWGDYLFRQDTMESIAQATQMYILADKLLGPKPRTVPPAVNAPPETYNQIERKLDAFGNALIDLENIIPDLSALPQGGKELPPPPVTLAMLYFCIPQNDKMLAYWDRIAERLFNIRHCRNIDGVERSLALFAPPIDPGMLVRAAASGLDISAVLAGVNAPTPFYRFSILSQKATELVHEVRGLGNSLLQALEKKDAEDMSRRRSELEMKVLNSVRDIKLLQIDEAKDQIEILKRTKAVAEERHKYYREIENISMTEKISLTLNGIALVTHTIGSIMEMTAGATSLIPDITVGVAGFGGTPNAVMTVTGGEKISSSISSFSKALLLGSQVLDRTAAGITTMAGYERREDEWKLQERLAEKEIFQIEKQIAAAEIRCKIAEADLKNHDTQIENAKQIDEFMRSKFTNMELYDWTVGQISAVYFKAYQLAFDFAKKAERCYRFELGNDDTFIGYGYWDNMKKGLQSADQLFHDLKRMEASYLDKNRREYEITKHISLQMLDPLALVRLRATGVCDFEIPEALYDMDHPGQYFRRIKSVSVSLPCIAGPYTSVSAKLSLVSNKYRKITDAGADYEEDTGNDERFVYNVGAIQSIAASNAQNDSGMFELNFRDERYLPFEGCGAIGKWRLELPKKVRQFDYNTIADVILHIKYTAREGGSLRSIAEDTLLARLGKIQQELKQSGLHIALNLKHDLPNEWHLLKTNGKADFMISKSRLPYFVQTIENVKINTVAFIAGTSGNPASYSINVDEEPLDLPKVDDWKLYKGNKTGIDLDKPFKLAIDDSKLKNLENLIAVIKLDL
ncbi:MAG: hypothetical protein LUM44_09485 [Pyrinomonadaceae bacterium]|nr:hypothetical protein [Pyrinomonadaceae bacterium]